MSEKLLPPVHPGEILLKEFIEPLGLTPHAVAVALRVPASRINDIVTGKRGITGDTALRLARFFGTDAESWLNLQKRYELESVRRATADVIERDVHPLERAAHG
ncbi:MAG: HigA family addiction module antidote protein [Gammaproteobacteria bacterium]|nr:HigA family addiction module antidote protein [Gammaproteobacteria bacterium]